MYYSPKNMGAQINFICLLRTMSLGLIQIMHVDVICGLLKNTVNR